MTSQNPSAAYDEAAPQRARQAARLTLIALALSAAGAVLCAVSGWVLGAWQWYALAGLNGVLAVASLVGAWWVRRGRVLTGLAPITIVILLMAPAISALVAGLGVVLLVTLVTVMTFIAAQNLSARLARWTLVGSALFGLAALLIDVYGRPNRLQIPQASPYLIAFSLLMTAAWVILLARRFNGLSLQAKLLVAFLLVTVIPLLGLGFLNDYFGQNNLTEASNQALLANASQTAAGLDAFIADRLINAQAQAELPAFIAYLTAIRIEAPSVTLAANARATIRALALQDPQHIESYALLNRGGVSVFDTVASAVGTDESQHSYFQLPLETGQPYASPVEFVRGTGAASIYFSAPVKTETGETLGILRVRYSAGVLQDVLKSFVQRAGVSAQTFAILLDENHVRLAHSSDSTLMYKSVVPLPADQLAQLQAVGFMPLGSAEALSTNIPEFEQGLQAMVAQPVFAADLVASGVGLDAIAAARLGTRPWLVTFAQPQDEFLQAIRNQGRLTILLALLVAGGAAAAAIVVAQLLAAPLLRLAQAAAQVTAGNLFARARVETHDEIGALATAFNAMTAQLRETLEGLERRVADRTRALAASAEVSRRLSTILDQQQLVQAVVDQIQNTFNYYHAHIYLFDEGREHLLMVGGTGEAGRRMLANEHKIPRGRGLVGRAAETNSAVVVTDVTQAVGWLPNPLLPETCAEVAVPIAVGGLVLGVLDVQHNLTGGLTAEDAELIQSVANQVAIALQNARSYRQTQRQAELEARINAISERIQSTTTVEAALQMTVREVGRALNAGHTQVRLAAPPPAASVSEREALP